ncbi:Putative SigmaB asociated two-component system sensor protein [Acidisarcina polymorpha]|uniref:histidine kinase n=1 Tax=Acidisarcina polymorpha TaxID=2211140 RepID=A0A2Z5G672_9BACT|nr:ATP-binding protein [Acidisarcina polymorpha]AXC14469.1 Putative SigmaB asociated two-component system sensor protein [Acidisarcina polymorpha]
MNDPQAFPILTLRLRHERHVVQARQRAREIAALLGFEHQEQIRLATATSELARNAFRYAVNGLVEFSVGVNSPQSLYVSVSDSGPGIKNLREILDGKYVSHSGLGRGIIGTKKLMDEFEIETSGHGTCVRAGKLLPGTAPQITAERARRLAAELGRVEASDPFEEIERQNQELLKTLADLREKQEQLVALNRELEDTNRGVVALYAELDQNAEDVRRVSDLKTSFLSNLSHEFRTPLNSITSLCQMLIGRVDGDLSSEQAKQVHYIHKSAAELTELVNDLLDIAKVEAGKIDIKPRHFEVPDLLGALRGMLKPLLTGNTVELIFDAEPDLPPLYTDEGKLSQVLRNLISNALKFTRIGYVRVSASLADEETILFQVADTGIGIAPEDQGRIFQEFVQIENDLQTRVKGTGLGLPLSKRLTELLGGTIGVESQFGAGSTFHVSLPIRYGKEQEPLTEVPDLVSPATGPCILFVEDNREARFVYESSLKTTNYHLLFAQNIPEARAVLKLNKPSIIALDRFIEGLDCLFFIQELRTRGYTGPIVVISVVDDERAVLAAGANRFLVKPISSFRLANTFRELLGEESPDTVLLADDDEITRYLLGDALGRLGYNVVEARNGREAIRIVGTSKLNGMFLDIVMPDLTGFEVLRELRRMPAAGAIPVIVHTSKELSTRELDDLIGFGAIFYPKQEFSSDDGTRKLKEVLASAGIGQ